MARTLWDALGEIEDQRGRKGRQYQLRSVLGIAIAAMLAGANDLRRIYRWGRRLRPEALKLFDIETGKAPWPRDLPLLFPVARRRRPVARARPLCRWRGGARPHRHRRQELAWLASPRRPGDPCPIGLLDRYRRSRRRSRRRAG